MELYACDTMVALGSATKSGKIIFAKNSDRPLNEAQPLVIIEGSTHKEGSQVECTYITIPQVAKTYRMLGSKPFWLWGFEHGMNEHNVVIGNEAVWSKEEEESENGLLGMDLLRLGLERGKTAYESLHIITDLLETYGQGGNAAQGKPHRYHNAFLIADPNEAWILDTVNRRWVARKVTDVAGISNCYSTECNWDEDGGNVKEYAYQKGWTNPNVPFNFAKAYSAMSIKHRGAHARFTRLNKLLKGNIGNITVDSMKLILRDHFEGELIAPRWSPTDGLHVSICMHCLDIDGSKTAAGSIIELDRIIPTWWSCLSSPCTSFFAPYYIDGILPANISHAKATFQENSLWWKFERLHYAIETDYPRHIIKILPLQQKLEEAFTHLSEKDGTPQEHTAQMAQTVQELEETITTLYKEIESDNSDTCEIQRSEYLVQAKLLAGLV